MKLFGLEINLSKRGEGGSTHKQLLAIDERYMPLRQKYVNCRVPLFTAIAWPSNGHLNDFERVAYDKAIAAFVESLTNRKRFSVCILGDLAELRCFRYTDETRQIKAALSRLHCVEYINIPPQVLEQIPGMMNAIFSEGRLKDVEHTPEPKRLNWRM